MSTPHNDANKNQIANIVLMPGDPLRAKYIATHYLEDAIQFNATRNMLGFTGTYKGKRVSVMGSGMGMPSLGIYAYELYEMYNVDTIIRVGSCGAYSDKLNIGQVYLAKASWSSSTFAKDFVNIDDKILYPTPKTQAKIKKAANLKGINLEEIILHSSDTFYALNSTVQDQARQNHAQACEMESFALFALAKALHKEAACLVSVSDMIDGTAALSAKEREQSFHNMMELALESAI